MVSLDQVDKAKVHVQSGTFRMRIPIDWARNNGLRTKDELKIIVSKAIIILPTAEMTEEEIEETIRNFRELTTISGRMQR
jgi:hypothetical protein